MVQLEEGVVALRVTSGEKFSCLLRESQRETVVGFVVLGKNLIDSYCLIGFKLSLLLLLNNF
jgi:hypothetical protein